MKSIDGQDVSLADYRGKALLIVNVASKCGFTKQYANLEALHQKFASDGFAVLGFPSNDFGAQEPGTEQEIKQFCSLNYDVTFPMFAKVKVKGADKAPVFDALTTAAGGEVKWNFTKFLVGKNGEVLERFESSVDPLAPALVSAVQKAIAG